ncbi:hypothetical protein [Blastopirellula marina]|uniref:hypothetical protein n=1 Tax=Blastopirellula marina TaxID=124 RepID=UPI0002F14334|nr:hypothetical protein [Blastopirellula marina]
MLNFFLLAALAFGVIGVITLVWSPALTAPASSGAPASTSIPLKLIPKNPARGELPKQPDPVDAFRAWFTVVRPVLVASQASPEEIRQAGLDLVKHLIMEAPTNEA